MSDIFNTTEEAWKYLVSHGGLEVNGRDADLVEAITKRLTSEPVVPDYEDIHTRAGLADILKRVSIEQLVNAVFGVVWPYERMMRDLFDYFSKAGTTEGPGQWKLALTSETDSLEIDLEDFKKSTTTGNTKTVSFEVPDLEPKQLWRVLFDPFEDRAEGLSIGRRPSTDSTDSAAWISKSKEAAWLPLPPVVGRMMQRNDELRDVAAAVYEMASAMQSLFPNYRTLYRDVFERLSDLPEDIREYAREEHDQWIETMVTNLAAFEIAPAAEASGILTELKNNLDQVKRRPAKFAISIDDLVAFLDLPVWKKRYELYSAWVLTQFLVAMQGHEIEFYTENGRLTFGFHATKLATIRSLSEPLSIYGERRLPATGLRGHGRKTGIQPDYTVYTEETDHCLMAIECKHYKRPNTNNFKNALDDYAANLPSAHILLGNYGPLTTVVKLDTKDGGWSGRQFSWGNLNPDHPSEVNNFRNTIRRILGEPLSREVRNGPEVIRILALDVSPSMHAMLRDKEVQKEIREITQELTITHFASVDDRLLAMEKTNEKNIDWFIDQSQATRTHLGSAAKALRNSTSELFFLTDSEGFSSLGPEAYNMWRFVSRFHQLKSEGAILARIP
jgi:hypothetical protein